MSDLQPNDLRTQRETLEILMYSFDFELSQRSQPAQDFSVEKSQCTVEACDAVGGKYASCQESNGARACWIYVGGEGRGGVVAPSFERLLGLVVSLPYWYDVLKYSAQGDLQEMRGAASLLERDTLDDLPDLPAARAHLLESLGLRAAADPVAVLHECAVVSRSEVRIVSKHGIEFCSLVGALSVRDNSDWR